MYRRTLELVLVLHFPGAVGMDAGSKNLESHGAGSRVRVPGIRLYEPEQLADHEHDRGQPSDDRDGAERVFANY